MKTFRAAPLFLAVMLSAQSSQIAAVETGKDAGTQTMKAVRIDAFGGIDALKYGDISVPQPKEDEVLIRVIAAGVNPYDVDLRQGADKRLLLPITLGLDVSGLVEKTGGISVYADAPDLGPLFRSLAAEVTSAYVIGFYPPEENRGDGKFHTVRVEATGGLILRQSRPGYKAIRRQ